MNKFLLFAAVFFSGCAILVSCNNPGTPKNADAGGNKTAFDTTAAKTEVEAANKMLSDNILKGDSVAAAGCYTADAKFMASNTPAVSGRKDIQGTFSALIKSGATKLDLHLISLWGGEDLLAEEGSYTLATKDGHQLDKGKYIVLWKKEDGKWKIFRDCNNSDLHAPGI